MKQTVKGINLLPKQYIQEQKIKRWKYIGGCALAVECLIFIAIAVIPPKVKIQKQQVTLDALQVQLDDPKYEGVNKAIADLEKARNDLAVWTKKYGTLKSPSFISARILDSMTARVPSGTVINNIKISPLDGTTGGVVSVEGTALDYGAAFSYVTVLENAYGSENVSFTVNRQEVQGEEKISLIQYTITVNVAGESLTPEDAAGTTETAEQTAEGNAEGTDGGQTS